MKNIYRNYLVNFRKAAGLTEEYVAQSLGYTSPRLLRYYESGQRDFSCVQAVMLFSKLSTLYKIPLMTLMQGEVDYILTITSAFNDKR